MSVTGVEFLTFTIQSSFSFDGCADTCVDGPKPQPQPRPQPRPTQRPRPQPTQKPIPRPQTVIFEEEEIESVVNPVIKTTRRPTTPPAPTTYRPSFTTPETTTGYSYEAPAPDVQLVLNKPNRPAQEGLPLYGPPAPVRRGRQSSRG